MHHSGGDFGVGICGGPRGQMEISLSLSLTFSVDLQLLLKNKTSKSTKVNLDYI